MKKLIYILFLLPFFAIGQVSNGTEFEQEAFRATNPQTMTSSDYIQTIGGTSGVGGRILGENISLSVIPPVHHFTPLTPNIKGYFQGVDDAIGNLPATTAGSTTRLWYTADQTTITAGTFYKTNFTNKGVVASAVQSVVNDDNQKKYFTQDLIGDAYITVTTFPKGVYAGNLSISVSPNSAQQRFTVEVYRCNSNGTPMASGITGAVVGDLGVTVVTILDSGLLTLADAAVTNVPVSGILDYQFTVNVGERVRYHISAGKVGTAASNITESVYFGTSYNSYIDVPVPLNTSSITNVSLVSGATTTEALNTLNSGKENVANKATDFSVVNNTLYPSVQAVKTQLDLKNQLISHLEFNNTDLTIWNNGKGNLASNTSFGDFAGMSNTTGTTWSAFGNSAGNANTTGISWTALGAGAGGGNATGSTWTAVGYAAGRFISDGVTPLAITNNSIFLGANTRALSAGSDNEIVIGTNTTGAGNNSITLGNTSTDKTVIQGRVSQITTAEVTDTNYDGYYSDYTSSFSGYNFHGIRQGSGGGGVFGGAYIGSGNGDGVIGRRRDSGEGNGGTFKREETGNGNGIYAELSGSGSGGAGLFIKSSSGTGHALQAFNSGANIYAAGYFQKSGASIGDGIYVEKATNNNGYSGNFIGGQGLNVNGGNGGITLTSSSVNNNNTFLTIANSAATKTYSFGVGKAGISHDGFGMRIDTGGIYPLWSSSTGAISMSSLAGTGNRLVVAASDGGLSATIAQPLRYTALISQSGTSAPTATVLENTLGGTISFTYVGAGTYQATSSGLFTTNKTAIFLTSKSATSGIGTSWTSTSTISILTAGANGFFDNTTFRIEVYP